MKIIKIADVKLTVTPIIKQTRTETFDVCPHCLQEIHEKSTFMRVVGDTHYTFHRGECADKNPISSFTDEDARRAFEKTVWGQQAAQAQRTAQAIPVELDEDHKHPTAEIPAEIDEVLHSALPVAAKAKVPPNVPLQLVFRCPDLRAGDELHVGKYKNVAIKVRGFRVDENNQPTVVSEDGTESKVFGFRIAKLLPPGAGNAR